MADLTIDVEGPTGPVSGVHVRVELTDSDGDRVEGAWNTDTDAAAVETYEGRTGPDGSLTIDVTPNDDILPANTYYAVTITRADRRRFTVLIEKGSGSESLYDALVDTPANLGALAPLADISGATDEQVIEYDTGTARWGKGSAKLAKAGDTATGQLHVTETTGKASITETGVSVRGAAADTHPKVFFGTLLGVPGVAFGAGGASAVDAAITRTAAGVLTVSTGKLRPGTPVASGDAADKAYVDVLDTYFDGAAAAATAAFMRKLMRNAEDVNLVICSDSTGDADDNFEWPYQLAAQLAAEFPTHTVKRARLTAGPVWGSQNTIQTGTGARTLNVWVASHAGRRFDFFVGEHKTLITSKTPDLLVVSHGHNEGDPGTNGATENTPEQFASRFIACAETFLLDLPLCPILVVLQNPRADNTHQEKRMQAIQRAAALRGYGVVDVMQAFLDTGDVASLLVDNLHPNEDGHDLWAATMAPVFSRSVAVTGSTGLNRSIFADPVAPSAQLAKNANFTAWTNTATAPDDWTVINSATVAQSNEQTDSDGFSCKIQNSGAASSGGIRNVFMSSTQVVPFRGQWVTAAARLWIPDGSDDDTAGVCRIYDGVNQTWSLARHGPHDGWFWRTVTHKVDAAATLLRVEILADYANTTGTIYVDRCCVVPGIVPRDVLRRGLSGS